MLWIMANFRPRDRRLAETISVCGVDLVDIGRSFRGVSSLRPIELSIAGVCEVTYGTTFGLCNYDLSTGALFVNVVGALRIT